VSAPKARAPGETHEVRRLLPDPAPVDLAEQIADLGLVALAPPERPYAVLNFATTLDGYGAIDGRSGPIGSDADTEVLQRLRTQVDAVMIGAGTMRAERYGRMVSDHQLRAWREQIGLAPDPLAVIVSGRLDLPWDASLFTDGNGEVLIFTGVTEEPPETATPVQVVRHEGRVDIAAAMRHLRTERDIRALLCEGGPGLHAELQRGGLADELFLTIAPKLAGGPAPHILEGELPGVIDMEQVWLLEREGELFSRYRRRSQ
jgi:riboflavin-specific deaminase-like protein